MMHKAACLLALAAPSLVAAQMFPPPVSALAFMTIPGYNGSLTQVQGAVAFGQDNMDTLVLNFALSNVDPRCANMSNYTNGCGIHIHSGTNCSVPGGHFYDMAMSVDPWLPVSYMINLGPTAAAGAGRRIQVGKTLADVAGKVVVIHDFMGTKIACSMVWANSYEGDALMAMTFTKPPTYSGALTSTLGGMAGVMQVGTGMLASQVIAFNLTGADPNCMPSTLMGLPPNGCGIHVHSGMNCSAPGGHYYAGMLDPWIPIKYTTMNGMAMGITPAVVTQLTRDNVTNRVLMVHDSAGKPFACAPIMMAMPNNGGGNNGGGNTNANFAKASYASPVVLAFLAVAQLFA